ncbi:crotonase/enoyl-CoA hydratase family protein [Sporichthya sp.]|uniref:crotonase/enoyl-CoA hydratase family protein n=1 Tax=Sporichthya sp. TaxID=65475 RepID=UPI0017D94754|nr:crotonase/enoyl-CoA hydratase family protein [Sporichthya sp.]MBA3742886.1 crotonase/enoyl-CoA hydratase family protein [Sporichthya sp.]
MSDKVLVEQRGHVLVVTLNRPEARNAVDLDVCVGVGDAVEQAEADPEIRALVITGAGDQAFCAGADLKAIARGELILPPGKEHWGFAGFVNHFTSKPTIAAVNGNALGGGTELLLACDLVVAAETANVGLPEVKRGLMAGAGGAFRIRQQLPPKVALELLLTGRPMPAPEALRWGLINKVVPAGQALDAALELADEIAANAPLSVQSSKRVAYGVGETGRTDEREFWKLSDREIIALLKTEDALEGPTAFAQKRAPVWKAR